MIAITPKIYLVNIHRGHALRFSTLSSKIAIRIIEVAPTKEAISK
jgi:hypothetical protein